MADMVFIKVQKINPETTKINPEFIRADKIENFRSYIKNAQHNLSRVEGDIIKVTMKNISDNSSKPIHEIYIHESEVSFSERLAKNGIVVIS